MQIHAGDRDVFIRSMASRGHGGGLASASVAAAAVMDASGFPLILIETVGTGQSEVEVAAAADTTVVLEAPEMGDEVQAIKAGLLEVADIVVVNKSDRPGADRAAAQLRAMLTVGAQHDRAAVAAGRPRPKRPDVMLASAITHAGVPELLAARSTRRRATGRRPDPESATRNEPTRKSRASSPKGSPHSCEVPRCQSAARRPSARSPTISWIRTQPPIGCSSCSRATESPPTHLSRARLHFVDGHVVRAGLSALRSITVTAVAVSPTRLVRA